MYTPKIGELVKIVEDTCGHGFPRGTVVKITSERGEGTWWTGRSRTFVKAEDIARLNPGIRKILKVLDKATRQAIEAATVDRPALKRTVRTLVIDIADEMTR